MKKTQYLTLNNKPRIYPILTKISPEGHCQGCATASYLLGHDLIKSNFCVKILAENFFFSWKYKKYKIFSWKITFKLRCVQKNFGRTKIVCTNVIVLTNSYKKFRKGVWIFLNGTEKNGLKIIDFLEFFFSWINFLFFSWKNNKAEQIFFKKKICSKKSLN